MGVLCPHFPMKTILCGFFSNSREGGRGSQCPIAPLDTSLAHCQLVIVLISLIIHYILLYSKLTECNEKVK